MHNSSFPSPRIRTRVYKPLEEYQSGLVSVNVSANHDGFNFADSEISGQPYELKNRTRNSASGNIISNKKHMSVQNTSYWNESDTSRFVAAQKPIDINYLNRNPDYRTEQIMHSHHNALGRGSIPNIVDRGQPFYDYRKGRSTDRTENYARNDGYGYVGHGRAPFRSSEVEQRDLRYVRSSAPVDGIPRRLYDFIQPMPTENDNNYNGYNGSRNGNVGSDTHRDSLFNKSEYDGFINGRTKGSTNERFDVRNDIPSDDFADTFTSNNGNGSTYNGYDSAYKAVDAGTDSGISALYTSHCVTSLFPGTGSRSGSGTSLPSKDELTKISSMSFMVTKDDQVAPLSTHTNIFFSLKNIMKHHVYSSPLFRKSTKRFS